jgi:hypothetical protein
LWRLEIVLLVLHDLPLYHMASSSSSSSSLTQCSKVFHKVERLWTKFLCQDKTWRESEIQIFGNKRQWGHVGGSSDREWMHDLKLDSGLWTTFSHKPDLRMDFLKSSVDWFDGGEAFNESLGILWGGGAGGKK